MIALLLCALAALLGACDWSLERMVEQDRCAPDETTRWLAGGNCAQPRPAGVVRFGAAPSLASEDSGLDAQGRELTNIPIALSAETLALGRTRYERFCAPCHGLTGDAHTAVAEHMQFRPPPRLLDARIRDQPDGHLFRVISLGYGLMPSYAHALDSSARWSVVAYVRVLERSQQTLLSELPPDLQEEARQWLR